MKILIAKYKKAILIGFITASFTTIISLPLFYFLQFRNSSINLQVLSSSDTQPTGVILPKDLKTLGILLLGYGGLGHQGGYLADAIQILYVDFDKSVIALISIPRDLWVKLDGKEMKINSVLAVGKSIKKEYPDLIYEGAGVMKTVVPTISGLKIDYFAAIDFVGFMRTVGIEFGGIEVEVSQTLDDSWYPISGEELNTCGLTPEEVADLSKEYSGFELEKQFPCRYEDLYFEKGLQHMEGGEALKYVRSRHGSADGDISRNKRQQEVLIAMKNKLISLEVSNNLPSFYEKITKHVQSDVNLEILQYLIPALQKATDFKIININLSTQNVLKTSSSASGQAIMIPQAGLNNWTKVQKYISEQISE